MKKIRRGFSKIYQQGRNITFISDCNKGLLEALPYVSPQAQYPCKYPSSLGKACNWSVQLFGRSAYAPTKDAFEMHMRTLKDESGAVIREFLKILPKENWSAAYFPGKKYGEMCSDVAESFNA
ncbi:hypothetical protein L3X38_025163 [Prunus dulcis]|uniref:Uncharacterized protein n=1 Tax=Prunus dulcis TaxID=3755 RepID=A0AAD4W179_PRUDU|nr:hypothetical protein L3X38_025163 [Prunus dulcis]